MWKRGGPGRSSALARAEAVLSSRRTSAAPGVITMSSPGPRQRAPAAHMSPELTDPGPGASPVAQHSSPLNSGAIRFLKKTSSAAQNQPQERAVSSSLRASQTAALQRLAQIENRFGKSPQISTSRVGPTGVPGLTEGPSAEGPSAEGPSTEGPSAEGPSTEGPSTERPTSAQSRCFVKCKPEAARGRDTVAGRHLDPSGHNTQQTNSKQQHYSEVRELLCSPKSRQDTSPIQPQSNMSPSCVSPSPPTLSPSGHSACGGVPSLRKLLPVQDPDSEGSDTGHFINLMDLDDLNPVASLLEENSGHKELEEELLEEELLEEEMLEEEGNEDYPSDFESVVHTEVLSHSQDSGQPPSPRSRSSYSHTFTRATTPDPSSPHASFQRDTPPARTDALSATASRNTQTSHPPAAPCGSCPSLRLLMESLRQQLAVTSHFIMSSQEQRARLLEGLGPPSYRYTTLEDTLKSISRASRSDQQTERR